MPTRAVLFDFDGVIADTENIHVAAWERTFAAMGREVPAEVCARSAEEDDSLFLQSIFAETGVTDGDIEGWVKRKQASMLEMLTANPRVYPGFLELVEVLQGKVSLAVVSGTWRENVIAVLRSASIESAFSLIVAKEDVKKFKPDPAAYVFALKALGLEPRDALALEDSPTGLASAKDAGVRSLAIGHRRPPGPWVGDSLYLPGLRPVTAVLEQL